MKELTRAKKGFTLLELVIIMAILGILAAVTVPTITSYVEEANIATDNTNLRMLNNVSRLFKLETDPITEDLFSGLTTDSARMNLMVSHGYLSEAITPMQKDNYFAWITDIQQWVLQSERTPSSLTGVTMSSGGHTGYIKGSYLGSEMNLVMPIKWGNVTITHVYQDVFSGKGLTSVVFDPDASIVEIHARAFNNNNLTEISIPDSVKRLDFGAFNNNPITKITIGAGVTLESNVFRNSNAFRDIYVAQGSGTYLYVNGTWVKQ
jgi:prepilin-type N-terminal cleavage/methylation domain-containing protein